MRPISVVLAGQPLAGKATTMAALRKASGAPLEVTRAAVPSGTWQGTPFNLLQMTLDCGEMAMRVSTVSGGVPIEGNELVLPNADLAVFVVDGRPSVRDRDVEWWRTLSPVARSRWVFMLNRRSDVIEPAAGILEAIGVDPLVDCLEYSALTDGSRVFDFLCRAIRNPA